MIEYTAKEILDSKIPDRIAKIPPKYVGQVDLISDEIMDKVLVKNIKKYHEGVIEVRYDLNKLASIYFPLVAGKVQCVSEDGQLRIKSTVDGGLIGVLTITNEKNIEKIEKILGKPISPKR